MTGRNDPCPCGSGKKYKKCHLDAEREASARSTTESVYEMDARLVETILRFGGQRFGREWVETALEGLPADGLDLYLPWLAWTTGDGPTTLAEQYLARDSASLTLREREWFAAQREARLGIWMVLGIAHDRLKARDSFTDELYDIRLDQPPEIELADFLLGRVVRFEGTSYFSGFDPRPLSIVAASAVAQVVRENGGNLATSEGAFMLFDLWDEGVELLDEIPVVYADEDVVEVFSDSFRYTPADEEAIERRITAIDGVVDEGFNEEGDRQYAFTDEEGPVGMLLFRDGRLLISTTSQGMAGELVRLIETACAGLLRDHDHASGEVPVEPLTPRPAPTPEMKAKFREKKEKRYRAWLDEPSYILDDHTMREAASDPRHGYKVHLLLKELAWREANVPESERVDVAALEREIGVEES